MAASKAMQMSMQIKCDLCSLFENNKLSDTRGVRRDAEMKVAMQKLLKANAFKKGKAGRDIASELYIPKHIMAVWRTPSSKVSIKYLFTIL